MNYRAIICVSILIVLGACQRKSADERFLIGKNHIGHLTKDTRVNQLEAVLKDDSIVNKDNSRHFSATNEFMVYNRDGNEALRLQPAKEFDSTSTIANIEVLDTMYTTKAGLRKNSEFRVIKNNYTIKRIENTLGAAVVFIDELNAYVIIDKKDILEPTEMGAKIKSSQIKDDAKIRHFWLGWD